MGRFITYLSHHPAALLQVALTIALTVTAVACDIAETSSHVHFTTTGGTNR